MPIKGYFKGSGEKVMKSMKEKYGEEKGKSVFYATANKQGMNPPSYEDGGVVPATGHAILHKGELVLPARKMKPPTPSDDAMSDDHLHDSVAFNQRHMADHLAAGRVAEDKLKERGVYPRTGTMSDAAKRALEMPLKDNTSLFKEGSPIEEAKETADEALAEGDPVSMRKKAQRASAESAVRSVAHGDVPGRTKGAPATHKFAKRGK